MERELPKRMYRHGLAYRIVNRDNSKVPLGRDLEAALRRYYVVMAKKEEEPACPQTMWKRHQKGAKQRGIVFTIGPEDVAQALEDQGGVCAVTGLAFRTDKPAGMRIKPWAASIDRINSSKGYEPGNIRVVCAFVNVAMNGFGEHFFEQVLEPLITAAVQARMWMSENGDSARSNTATGISTGISA